MMKFLIFIGLVVFSTLALADELTLDGDMGDRDPAAVTSPTAASKRTYPGGADEDDLQVQARLPDATLKTDARSLQREVYKTLYNQELKDEGRESVEE